MTRDDVDRIADAVLYEGYILYPYRPSLKNRRRWTFGGLFPEAYCRDARDGSASSNQTECLVRGTAATTFEARVRFLHLTDRRVGVLDPPRPSWPDGEAPPLRPVPELRVGDQLHQEWQEAEEREVTLGAVALGDLARGARHRDFAFPGGRRLEPLRDEAGAVVGALVREQETIAGVVEAQAVEADEGLFRVRLSVANRSDPQGERCASREAAALCALASTHAIFRVRGGVFLSLIDPPEGCRAAAAACRNVGAWPVLIGARGESATMLSAPIILDDDPRVAPESPGDFFDGTEIDEMLTLRIMTLTDAEKAAMAEIDPRARALLERTEATAGAPMLGLHGTLRDPRAARGEAAP